MWALCRGLVCNKIFWDRLTFGLEIPMANPNTLVLQLQFTSSQWDSNTHSAAPFYLFSKLAYFSWDVLGVLYEVNTTDFEDEMLFDIPLVLLSAPTYCTQALLHDPLRWERIT